MTEQDFEPVFHILHDLPEDNDAFGPHRKIAETLSTLIAGPAQMPDPDSDHGGYFVALEGGWGSGKSTVIKMLRNCLKDKTDLQSEVIIFDAWAHSGDHLRRAFLEVLVTQLIDAKLLKDATSWTKELDGLSGRIKVGTEKRTPSLTWQGKLFSLSLLLMPVGGVLASSALGKMDWPWKMNDLTWHTCVGVLLTALPLLVIAFAWLWSLIFGTKDEKSSVTSMLFNRWDDVTTIETESDPDPTSIEFQRLFQGAVAEALSDRSHRLVLVIDNLDRLPPRDAMHLWRTLQTFIDKNEHDPKTWAGKLWTIVPYDRSILKKHFSEVRVGNDDELPLIVENKGGNELGHFEKIFDTSLHVPSPAPTLWQSYFKDLLQQAFPNEKPEEIDTVIRLMEAVGGLSYTPRNLKRTINSVGPIYLQWRSEFSLADTVFYVLNKRHPPALDEGEEQPSVTMVLGTGYLHKMEAIKFNAPIEIARQIQLISLIDDALKSNTSTALSGLVNEASNFNDLLLWACQKNVAYWDWSRATTSAHNIDDAGIFDHLSHIDTVRLGNLYSQFIERIIDKKDVPVPTSNLGDDKFCDGLIHINTFCNRAPISLLLMTSILSEESDLDAFLTMSSTEITNGIQRITISIHETQPSIFDDDLVSRIMNLEAIKKFLDPNDAAALKTQLTSHQT